MVRVTRLNKKEFLINPHMIEFMEATPDTVITLISGTKVVVAETVDEVIERIIDYRRQLGEAGREPLPSVVYRGGEE